MKSLIRIYLFPDTLYYITSHSGVVLDNVEKDTNTKIYYHKRDYDSYLEIEGGFESVHKARIILQNIEREIYKEVNQETSRKI
jgi:hypothetical protein